MKKKVVSKSGATSKKAASKRATSKKATSKKEATSREEAASRKEVASRKRVDAGRAPALDAEGAVRLQGVLRARLERHQSYNPPSKKQESCRPLLGDPAALARHVAANAKGIADEHYMLLAAAEQDCPELFALAPAVGPKKLAFFLPMAALHGSARVLAALLARGVDPDARDLDGVHDMTALHWAVEQDRPQAVKVLLAGGADRTLRDRKGKTPLDRARTLRRAACSVLLEAPG